MYEEKGEQLFTSGGSANAFPLYKSLGRFPTKLEIDLAHVPTIPLMGNIQRTCSSMFTDAL